MKKYLVKIDGQTLSIAQFQKKYVASLSLSRIYEIIRNGKFFENFDENVVKLIIRVL